MTKRTRNGEIRGMFGPKGDSESWLKATQDFPNGVPRFDSKAECLDFVKHYLTHHGGSNPDHPHLQHIFTTLISWEQIERILLPAINKARKEPSASPKVPRDYGVEEFDRESTNTYEQAETKDVSDAIAQRLNVPFHACTNPSSVFNTLYYLFFHMKCGIYVMIRNGKLRIFAPFTNSDYQNTWSKHLKVEYGNLTKYYDKKTREEKYRAENIEKDRSKWWANGNVICNELNKKHRPDNQYWGDQFLSALRDMLGEACRERQMPDCEFFLNKRDYPHLKVNLPRGGIPVEPYGFIFDKDDRDPSQDVDLAREHKFSTYAPIVSFYAAAPDRFTDVPWPSSEDWEAACGLVFPNTFIHQTNKKTGEIEVNGDPRDLFTESNFRKFEMAWDDPRRVPTAFFRGTASGGGTTIENNQRLRAAQLSHDWKDDSEKGGSVPYLDAKLTGWNPRDKKVAGSPMTFIRKSNFPFEAGKVNHTPIYQQSKYKYLLYIDGHCAACRYGFMMRLGSVILKVEARQVADRMWYFPLLKPYHDHVPVKADLSDLEQKIEWCRRNDDKCREIGQNALAFYNKYVARGALLDCLQIACRQMSKRHFDGPEWWEAPPPKSKPPQMDPPRLAFCDKAGGGQLCRRCQEDKEKQVAKQEAEQAAQQMNEVDREAKKRRNLEFLQKYAL